MRKHWVLPSGLELKPEGSGVVFRFKPDQAWITLCASGEELTDLRVVIDRLDDELRWMMNKRERIG